MTIDDFWKLVALVDRDLLKGGDDEAAVRPLIDALAVLEKPELQSFQDHLSQTLYDIDGRAYFEASAVAGGTDDSFLYVRCFAVAMGRDAYQGTLENPDLMPNTLGQSCELLLYAAQSAWQEQTGEEVEFDTKVSFESGSNPSLWPPVPQSRTNEVEHLRRIARQSRAEANNDPVFEKDYRQIADNYERMAEQAEKKLKDKPA